MKMLNFLVATFLVASLFVISCNQEKEVIKYCNNVYDLLEEGSIQKKPLKLQYDEDFISTDLSIDRDFRGVTYRYSPLDTEKGKISEKFDVFFAEIANINPEKIIGYTLIYKNANDFGTEINIEKADAYLVYHIKEDNSAYLTYINPTLAELVEYKTGEITSTVCGYFIFGKNNFTDHPLWIDVFYQNIIPDVVWQEKDDHILSIASDFMTTFKGNIGGSIKRSTPADEISGPDCELGACVSTNGQHCNSTTHNCHNDGTEGWCPKRAAENEVGAEDEILPYNFVSNSLLYDFRDNFLNSSSKGREYIAYYYQLGKNIDFTESTLNLAFRSLMLLSDFETSIDLLLEEGHHNEVIIDEDFASSFILLLEDYTQHLSLNSEAVNAFEQITQDVKDIKGMTKAQIIQYLNE